MKNGSSCSLVKRIAVCFTMALSLSLYPWNSGLNAQSVASETSNSSCEAGGEMWVCGASQMLQAHRDFDNNCDGWTYQCNATVRTIVDVCDRFFKTSYIYADGPNCRS